MKRAENFLFDVLHTAGKDTPPAVMEKRKNIDIVNDPTRKR